MRRSDVEGAHTATTKIALGNYSDPDLVRKASWTAYLRRREELGFPLGRVEREG